MSRLRILEQDGVRGMSRRRAATVLAWILGVVFIVLGLVEVAVRLASDEAVDGVAVAFWLTMLCGGGALVLVGSFVVDRTSGWSFALVALGCFLGGLATAWTVVLPILAVTLLVLAYAGGKPAAARPDDAEDEGASS
jgi:hypothetical protein